MAHTIRDPITLSEDEFTGADSETDYTDLDIDLATKNDSYSPHVVDNKPVEGDVSSSGITRISGSRATDHQDDNDEYKEDLGAGLGKSLG